ncbi:stalk domain-containing protein [Cohnella suwonensis]|uniref:Stalk domain-containing protein n=1 Tax=Cohnella suwonensis TaxID=696072 RepID=A0ABW0LXT6_9BACL
MAQHTQQVRPKGYLLIAPLLAGALVLSSSLNGGFVPRSYAATALTYQLVKQTDAIVTSGVRELSYGWVPSDAKLPTEAIHVLQVDLTNPYVKLDAMGGPKGSVTAKQSVGAMAKETGAVAGINGDVFRTGISTEAVPMGAQITSGKLLVSTEQLTGMYAFGVTNDGKPMIDQFTFTGKVTAADGTTFALTGMNKSAYMTEPNKAYSHMDALYIYTNAWTAPERPVNSSTKPTEALVVDGIVTEISVGTPIKTAIPANGYILRGHGDKTAADFIKTHLIVGEPVQSEYALQSLTNGATYAENAFQMMVSGHTLLVDQGVASAFTRNINGVSGSADRARTAVGYSQDGSTAYLVTVEENGGREGVTLKELQQILTSLGAWKAINLDGGGSTTMVSRPLGEFQIQLSHPTFYGTTQRLVTNGIGVYTTAPQGELKGITASGPRTLFVGGQASYSLKAYDTYYNPLDPMGLAAVWQLDKAIGTFNGGTLTATKPGKATLSVSSGQASDKTAIEVIGEAQISQLTVEPSSRVLRPGAVISVPVKATLSDGRQLSVPAASIKWEFRGFTGKAEGGKITVDQVQKNATAGYAIARYDGYGTVAVLAPGTEKTLEDFEKATYNVGFAGTPVETVGTTTISTGILGRENSKVLVMDYDFTNGSGKRYANAVLNDGKGISIADTPNTLTLDILGDQSSNWLRAEFTDAKGKTVYITIADKIDWSGWKNVRVDLAAGGLTGQSKLTKLYLVNQEEGQDERAVTGELAFDNLVLQYPPAQIAVPKPTIVMTVGKKDAKVDGKKVTLPGAPFNRAGTNYVPLQYIAAKLGAIYQWDNAAKKITALRGDRMLELWVGSSKMILNGKRLAATGTPILLKNNVYVPVRVITEQLGMKVEWDPKKKTITIH